MACIRFSAWSNTTEWGPRNTWSVTSRMSTPCSSHWAASWVLPSWKEGRQCMNSTSGLPVSASILSSTRKGASSLARSGIRSSSPMEAQMSE